MRSIAFTLLLLFLAVVSVGLAVVRITDGSLNRVFGAPANPAGSTLYDFDPREVRDLLISGNSVAVHCSLTPNGWEIINPWRDRMDPRAVQAILDFTLNSRVEGAIPTGKVESKQLGFEDGRINIRIADAADDPLAKYVLGHRTAWFGTDPTTGELIPTVYVQPRDRNRKDYYYACTDSQEIHSWLKDGLRRLRDHHPFLFHPNIVESVRIQNRNGKLLLSRSRPDELWKIVQPGELNSDPESTKRLVQGLYNLEALNVRSRSEVTLPAADPDALDQIALRFFGQPDEVVLEIYPPDPPDSPTVFATVSDRPDAVFELTRNSAVKESAQPVGLADLPLSVNELRDPTLTNLDVTKLEGILISSARDADILISRNKPSERFKIELGSGPQEANETALFSLLSVVTEGRVTGFVSDTVANTAEALEPYGLNQPFLTLRFLAFDGSTLQLDFGQAKDGSILAMRAGSHTVFKIDSSMLALIPTHPWEWRPNRLWTLSPPDIVGINRLISGRPPLELQYDFIIERWKAREQGIDRSTELATDRADRMLEELVKLKVENWLRADDPAAARALAQPAMELTILQKIYDSEGEFSTIEERVLTIAPFSNNERNLRFYGRVSGEPNPFLLDLDTVRKITVDLFGLD